MYLSAQEISQYRDHTLNNLLGLSSASLAASQRIGELLAGAGRDALHHGSKHLSSFGHGQVESLFQLPLSLWLDGSARGSKLLDSASSILGEAHKAMIQVVDAQTRNVDGIERAARSSPWEASVVLGTLRTTLEGAGKTWHNLSSAAIKATDAVQEEIHKPLAGHQH